MGSRRRLGSMLGAVLALAGAAGCAKNEPAAACTAAASCPGSDTACRQRTCVAGACGHADAPNDTACDDGDASTTGDVCTGGVCAGIDHCVGVICTALDQCHDAGSCVDHATGACSHPAKADSTACDDGNPSTTGDVCTGGMCAGVDHCVGVICPPPDQCHDPGVCVDHETGACSNPAKTDGAPCNDGNACTVDVCQVGVCVGTALSAGTACGPAHACDGAGLCLGTPMVMSTTLTDGATILASVAVGVTFDQAMDPATLTAQTAIGPCSGSIQVSVNGFATCVGFATAAPTMTDGNRTATLVPAPGLLINRIYAIRITTAATGASGLALPAPYDSEGGMTTDPLMSGIGSARNESDSSGEVQYCALGSPNSLSGVPAGSTVGAGGVVWDSGYGAGGAGYASLTAQVGFGPATVNPEYQSGWTWVDVPFTMVADSLAQYAGAMVAPAAGSYATAFRVSLDGGLTWTYCDAGAGDGGAGSNVGLTFDLENEGVLVTQ